MKRNLFIVLLFLSVTAYSDTNHHLVNLDRYLSKNSDLTSLLDSIVEKNIINSEDFDSSKILFLSIPKNENLLYLSYVDNRIYELGKIRGFSVVKGIPCLLDDEGIMDYYECIQKDALNFRLSDQPPLVDGVEEWVIRFDNGCFSIIIHNDNW